MRTIGIVGRSFCGSTLLSRLLASVPGAASPGEIHWLRDNEKMSDCRVCGPSCKVFTPRFWRAQQSDDSFYQNVAEHLEVETLISSDKTAWLYERFVQPQTMDAILLVRSPFGVAASEKHRGIFQPRESARRSILTFLSHYALVPHWCRDFCCKTIVVTYEDLCAHPQEMVTSICKALELPAASVPQDLSTIRSHHIGGGIHTYATKAVVLDERWKQTLNAGEQRAIREHPSVMRVYERLKEQAIKPA
jgi:hypothetical protein